MIHRMLRYPSGWEWHALQQAVQKHSVQEQLPSRKIAQTQNGAVRGNDRSDNTDAEQEQLNNEAHAWELKRLFPASASWIDDCSTRKSNVITVADLPDTGPVLYGTLMVQMTEELDDVSPFHFWLTSKRLITIHDDMRLPLRLQNGPHTEKLAQSGTAPEAFFAMLGQLIAPFHAGLDGFEQRLGELEAIMRHSNRAGLIDEIFERRYDLLHWTHLFTPLRELHSAAKEAFMDDLSNAESFLRMHYKLERIETLLRHYASEIDTLISMDSAISSFKGNDIMRTLTIFTVLFLPATIAGTLWGTNFIELPWKNEVWGFPALVTIVIIITTIIFIWLWTKGWTGDLLYRKRNERRRQELYQLIAEQNTDHQPLSRIRSAKQGTRQLAVKSSELNAEHELSRRKKHSHN